ncbi:MAG: helix-turn-helix transcriptional regulator [Xenococcus sp. MO_188.B8]|nr:helix-turn-helix transcriptional regulator [Xenococcus sp. MO_188.B8]
MPEQNDKIFKFNKTQVDELQDRCNLYKNNLNPQQIKQTTQWLRAHSNLLRLVADLLAFRFIKRYEELVKIQLKTTINPSESELPPVEIIRDLEDNVTAVKLKLDEGNIAQIVKHLENDFAPEFEAAKIWEKTAEELLTNHEQLVIEKLAQLDLLRGETSTKTGSRNRQEAKSAALESEISLVLQDISQRVVSAITKGLDLPKLTLADLNQILRFKPNQTQEPIPVTEPRLTNDILAVPTFAALTSAIRAQIRKEFWHKDDNGLAYFKHQAKGNPNNYIEHYISSPGDITVLPWEQAEQIIDKYGFNTVKLHLIFAAHTMNQPVPWEGKFCLKASDVIKYLGWDKRTDLPVHQKLSEIAKTAFVLDCLLVKSVWVEGRNKKGGINASTPTGRMWNVVVDPRGQLNLAGKVEQPEEVYITVQPGLIFHSFLNKAGSKLKEALYQFGYLAKDILTIDPYHDELALRLAIHLAMESRIHVTGKYRVETLLKALLPHNVIDKARSDKRKGYDLRQRWDNALKLLQKLKWQIRFDESYPEWLQPGSQEGKPKEARKMKIIEWLLQAKLTINPPDPIPELLAANVKRQPKAQKRIPIRTTGLTSEQIRKARKAKGWSQRKLAGWLGVSNALVGYWEKGKRTPSEEMETKLRELLPIKD